MANLRRLCYAALVILTTAPILGQTLVPGMPSEALLQDAASYADQHRVGLDEAVRRLQLQREVGELDAALSQGERDTFAGLWIEHKPEYKVIVRFTDQSSEERLKSRVAGTSLEGLVEMRPAALSLVQLGERRAAARQLIRQLRFAVDTDINVRENRAEIHSDRPQQLRAALAAARARLPERVEIIPVTGLSEPAVLRGGEHGSTCTGGFTVRGTNSENGISTAAHCGNSQSFQGVSLPFRSEDQEGNQDVQWHSACALTVSNEFNSGIGFRACVGTQHRDQQAIGSYICKYGMTAGRYCGYIQSKNISLWWVTNSAATFVRGDGVVTLPGDSGGPWFVEDIAYGITSGRFTDDDDGIYMAINYISTIGASVLTSNPGPCPVCGNGVCEGGENSSTCCDCAFCGNGACEGFCGESNSTCSIDCPSCGNGVCENGEDQWNCSADCGGSCGDGFCDVLQGECASNCPQDCTSGEICQ